MPTLETDQPRKRGVRDWAIRHRWLSALILVVLVLAALYAAFVIKFVWDMQHSSL